MGFLFDLDGVLIDSEKEYTRIWNEIEQTFPTGKTDFALSIKGQTLNKILDDNYKDNELKQKVTDMLHRLENDIKYTYCEGAANFLDKLKSIGRKIAVVTSSDSIKMAHLYSDLPDFKDKIDVVIDSSKVINSKPHPEGYLLAAATLRKDIRNCIVFEDSVEGVKAGRCSGAFVVGITGTKKREELLPFSDLVIDCLNELTDNFIEQRKLT